MFYRESLKAILDQSETVEAFMNQGDNPSKWAEYFATPSRHLGEVKDVFFSFTHPLVDAHFQFAFFMLDILGDINTIFQLKYAFILISGNIWLFFISFLLMN